MNSHFRAMGAFFCFFLSGALWANSSRPSGGSFSDEKKSYVAMVREIARQEMVDPYLISAIITCESDWNPRVRSPKGAVGLMQLMPTTARNWGVTNPLDPYQNILAGTRHMKYLLALLDQNVPLAIAAYHAGEARILKDGTIPSIPETENYVRSVQLVFEKLAAKR